MKVIGYYYEIYDEVLEKLDTTPEELVGTTLQLCFGRVVDETQLEPTNTDDIVEQMLTQNLGKIVEMNGMVAKVMLEHPVPEEIFRKYYIEEELIYE